MNYRATEAFWESFYDLRGAQKESVRRAWLIFKEDPFDPRLRAHKIHRLSNFYHRTIYAAVIEADLRILFYIDAETVWTVDVGTHDLYRQ